MDDRLFWSAFVLSLAFNFKYFIHKRHYPDILICYMSSDTPTITTTHTHTLHCTHTYAYTIFNLHYVQYLVYLAHKIISATLALISTEANG